MGLDNQEVGVWQHLYFFGNFSAGCSEVNYLLPASKIKQLKRIFTFHEMDEKLLIVIWEGVKYSWGW